MAYEINYEFYIFDKPSIEQASSHNWIKLIIWNINFGNSDSLLKEAIYVDLFVPLYIGYHGLKKYILNRPILDFIIYKLFQFPMCYREKSKTY